MATVKNPSIYDDRGTIGSADELDEYGVWVKLEPEELSDNKEDHFPDFDADFVPEMSLDETAAGDVNFEDFVFSDDGGDANFDDVEALRQDIQSASPAGPANAAPVTPSATPTATPTAPDLSTQLLTKIADELSSIKNELSALKEDLSAIRFEKPERGASNAGAEDAGFFDEEGDDKIALTGDELDNIIHTAAFTEETGSDAVDSLAEDFATESAPPSGDEGEIIDDSLGRPQRMAAPENGDNDDSGPATAPAEEKASNSGEDGVIYDGLGRPLNRTITEEEDAGTFHDLTEDGD
jgi:hypothetical protein